MKINKALLLIFILVLGVAFASIAFAAGSVYYGPEGKNFSGCGSGTPCKTYKYAKNRACQLSDSEGNAYAIYHTSGVYAGYCDKSGGGGVQPGSPEPGAPYDLGSILWPMLSMFVAGLVLGNRTHRRIGQSKQRH